MTSRVTRDKEFLAAWPSQGTCWKVVRLVEFNGTKLHPLCANDNPPNYSEYEDWLMHEPNNFMLRQMLGFHCLTSLEDVKRALKLVYVQRAFLLTKSFGYAIQEFEYDGLLGIGSYDDMPVLLCDRVKPKSYVSLDLPVTLSTPNEVPVTSPDSRAS